MSARRCARNDIIEPQRTSSATESTINDVIHPRRRPRWNSRSFAAAAKSRWVDRMATSPRKIADSPSDKLTGKGGSRYSFMSVFRKLATLVSFPVTFAEYFAAETGAQYGISFAKKLQMARQMRRHRKYVQTASSFPEQLAMITQILKISASTPGCLVECGTWKGGSAASLSLAASLCGRELHIFDSFSGLPPSECSSYGSVGDTLSGTYAEGDYCGQLEEVKENIRKHGNIESCIFHPGFFCDTLQHFQEPCAFVFLDVDLIESLQDCLRYLWPKLQKGCYLFTHEARDWQIVAAFYDRSWWQATLNVSPPGLMGGGSGLGLHPAAGGASSDLGCAVKI